MIANSSRILGFLLLAVCIWYFSTNVVGRDEFDPYTHLCQQNTSERDCLKEKLERLAESELHEKPGSDVKVVVNRINSDTSRCDSEAGSVEERDECQIPIYKEGIDTLFHIAQIGRSLNLEFDKCDDKYCREALTQKSKAMYQAFAQARYDKWLKENVETNAVPEGEEIYQLKYEPSCKNGTPYMVCQDRRLLKLENRFAELEPSASYYGVAPYTYQVREDIKAAIATCGQDPNCYERVYRWGIFSYVRIIEVGKKMRDEQAKCSSEQECWNRANESAQIALATSLEALEKF